MSIGGQPAERVTFAEFSAPFVRSLFFAVVLLSAPGLRFAALASSADSARAVPRWRFGVQGGTLVQRFVSGLSGGVAGRWAAKNGVIGIRLEGAFTHVAQRWQQPDAMMAPLFPDALIDVHYRSRYLSVTPLLDVALLRSRRLHVLAGGQINTWLHSAWVRGQEPSNRIFFSNDGQSIRPVYIRQIDQRFQPSGNPFRLVAGAAWDVKRWLEIGLRAERGERVNFPGAVRSGDLPPVGRLVAVRLMATWWVR